MKLLRVGKLGKEIPAILDNENKIRDLSKIIQDFNPDNLNFENLDKIKKTDIKSLAQLDNSQRIGACITEPVNFLAIGLNYKAHAEETNSDAPKEPIVFNKSPHSVIGPNDEVMLPKGIIPQKGKAPSRLVDSKRSDWEVELGIVIGDKARSVPDSKAMQYIAGYTIVNDVSERAYQLDAAAGQWTRGKGCDTFCPVGPWLVTKDEISRPQNLSIWLELNGKKMQNGNTKTMVFNIKELISYVSHYMTLYPGDIIATGTPPGVGMGMKTPRYLKKGDEMKLGIDGLGAQVQKVVSWKK